MKIKDKFKQIINSDGFVFIFFIFLEAILFFLVNPIYRDDLIFSQVLNDGKTIFEVISHRYNTWSSRSIIEIVLIFVAYKPKILWQILQVFFMWLMAYSISRIFIKKENKKIGNYIICTLLLTYPMFNFAAAGWEATTINYIWPLSLALFSFISIKKTFNNEKIKIFEYILYILAIIFACNMEQMCFIVFGVYLFYGIKYYINNKKISKFMLVQIVISILSLVFIFSCNGNYIRQQSELKHYLDYPTLSNLDKISLCFTSTFNDMINWTAFPITILVIIMPLYVFYTYKENIYRSISLLPAIIFLPLKYFNEFFIEVFPYMADVRNSLATRSVLINVKNMDLLSSWLILTIAIIFFASLIITLTLISNNLKYNKAILVFLVGLASKFMMVFTSTIFSSAPRTIMYFEFSIYIVIALILQELINKNRACLLKIMYGISIFAVYQFINNIFFIIKGII